ncbi:MAG TPA: hypothetical protein PK098_00620 [Phycisphaerales bacterium]|nr:hypothetical protein [Phycisphaerales bacterium]
MSAQGPRLQAVGFFHRISFTMMRMWSCADIADAVEQGLILRAQELDAEHAVYGIDSCDELSLHPVIEQALRAAGYGVHREQRYPADWRKRSLSEGERCDFVLTPPPGDRSLRLPEAKATLFDAPDAVELDDAFWLEVKVVSQFTREGANGQYASQLLSTVRQDVTKLAKDAGILHAGLLLLLFVRDHEVAEHDLRIWQDRCLERSLPIAAPCRRDVPIGDRMGHTMCAIALYPVRHL